MNMLFLATPYATHEKAVNDVLLRTVARSVFTFSKQDSTILKDIAALCPLPDGEAVLRARALLTLVEEEPEANDDEDICNIERGVPSQRPSLDFLRVFPNPATEEVIVEYNIADTPGKHFLLVNTLGQITKEIQLPGEKGALRVSLDGLPEGIYWYFVPGANKSVMPGKIIINR